MRVSRLAGWIAGGVAGCPGTVATIGPEDPTTPSPAPQVRAESVADPCTQQPRRRSRWITAAALVLIAEGLLVIPYLPALTTSSMGPLQPLMFLIGGLAVLDVAAGIGLLRLRGWARLLAGAVSSFVLLFMYAPALAAAVANGAWLGFDWLGVVGNLVVLFAVLRRWPTAPAGAD